METNNAAFFPFMGKMTVKQVREYLQQKQSIIIPLGIIEQHGYHLPLSCDALIAEQLSQRIGLKTEILVAPTVYQSYSGGGLPGTINISPSVMSLLINDMLISLVSQGFRNFYLFLAHGGSENTRALNDALKLLLRNNPAFEHVLIALLPIWKFDSKKIGWKKALKEKDWHAGWLETSIVMALEPDLVRMDELELDPEPLLNQQIEHPDNYQHSEKMVDDELVIPRIKQRPEIKVGVMGHPERASRELGLKIVEDIVATAAAKIVEIEKKADGKYKSVPFNPEPLIF
jgi:creatinine amidohydrolase